MKTNRSTLTKFVNYLQRTMMNKLLSSLLMLASFITSRLCGDYTAFVFVCMIGIPWFFAKENLTYLD